MNEGHLKVFLFIEFELPMEEARISNDYDCLYVWTSFRRYALCKDFSILSIW